MKEYHKINSIYLRDMSKKNAPFVMGLYAQPEFMFLKDIKWSWTEKIDGTNIRVQLSESGVEFGGKSDNAQIPAHLFKVLQDKFTEEKLKKVFRGEWKDTCLYGEGFGYKIQGKVGVDYLKDKADFILFDVRVGGLWLQRAEIHQIAEKLKIEAVPNVGYGTLDEAIEFVKSEPSSKIGEAKMEGLVLRPVVELKNGRGERIITKVKVRDFKI